MDALVYQAKQLRALHADGTLVLPNAWDAASAAVIADAGAAAIATTSAGVSWSLGRRDGEQLTRAELVAAIGRIAAVIDVPLTADIESGFGPTDADVAQTVTAVLEAGAVGINIEDAPAHGQDLYPTETAASRIRAARAAAIAYGVPDFVINARTDVHMRQIGDPATRPDEVLHRARAYAEAGADCLFVPGVPDVPALVAASPLPVNVLIGPDGPTVAELRAAGVRRISVGPALSRAAYTTVRRLAEQLLTDGRLTADSPWLAYRTLNSLATNGEGR